MNNFDLKKYLAENRLVKENINDIDTVETLLNELVEEYISDTLDIAGDDLDFGDGKIGYKNKKDLIQDFILYLESFVK
jgi:hypothetical protein